MAESGQRVGITRLGPHDLRHYWATQAARSGTPLDRLREAGGWSSLAMPLRYIRAAQTAVNSKARDKRYELALMLVLVTLAKRCGEDQPYSSALNLILRRQN